MKKILSFSKGDDDEGGTGRRTRLGSPWKTTPRHGRRDRGNEEGEAIELVSEEAQQGTREGLFQNTYVDLR